MKQHSLLIARLIASLRKYVQNHFIEISERQDEGEGIMEMLYGNVEAFQESMDFIQSPAGKELEAGGAKFADM